MISICNITAPNENGPGHLVRWCDNICRTWRILNGHDRRSGTFGKDCLIWQSQLGLKLLITQVAKRCHHSTIWTNQTQRGSSFKMQDNNSLKLTFVNNMELYHLYNIDICWHVHHWELVMSMSSFVLQCVQIHMCLISTNNIYVKNNRSSFIWILKTQYPQTIMVNIIQIKCCWVFACIQWRVYLHLTHYKPYMAYKTSSHSCLLQQLQKSNTLFSAHAHFIFFSPACTISNVTLHSFLPTESNIKILFCLQ